MDLLRKLRSIEKGRLPKDEEISLGSSSTAMSLAFKSLRPTQGMTMKKARPGVGDSGQSMLSQGSNASERDEESKDAASIVLDTESILSFVDEPFSINDLEEHKQHALSSTMLRNLLQSSSPQKYQSSPSQSSLGEKDSPQKNSLSPTTSVNEGESPINEDNTLYEEMSQITMDTHIDLRYGTHVDPLTRSDARPDGRGGNSTHSIGTLPPSIQSLQSVHEKEEDEERQEVLFSIHDSYNQEENESVNTTMRINDEIQSENASLYSQWEQEKQVLMLDVKRNIDNKITTAIDKSIEIIPVDLLIKYGKFELGKHCLSAYYS